MRLLANENIPLDAVQALRKDENDVLWIREEAPGSTDIEVMKLAHEEKRVLITFYKDSGNWLSARNSQQQVE